MVRYGRRFRVGILPRDSGRPARPGIPVSVPIARPVSGFVAALRSVRGFGSGFGRRRCRLGGECGAEQNGSRKKPAQSDPDTLLHGVLRRFAAEDTNFSGNASFGVGKRCGKRPSPRGKRPFREMCCGLGSRSRACRGRMCRGRMCRMYRGSGPSSRVSSRGCGASIGRTAPWRRAACSIRCRTCRGR